MVCRNVLLRSHVTYIPKGHFVAKTRRKTQKTPRPGLGEKKKPWTQRAAIWLAGIGGALTIAAATAFGTGVGQRLFSEMFVQHSGDKKVIEPIQIQSAGYIPGFNEVFAFPDELTKTEILKATKGMAQSEFAENMRDVLELGGAPDYIQRIQVVLHSRVKQVSTITGIEVNKKCSAPFTGTELWNPAQSAISNLSLGLDLDRTIPIAQFITSGQTFRGNFFAQKSIQLASGESDTLLIYALTTRHSCLFTLKLLIDYGARQYVENVTNDGQPFKATAGLPFARFKEIYAGGPVVNQRNGIYIKVNPRTFRGYQN
jgi:hypothetical protein